MHKAFMFLALLVLASCQSAAAPTPPLQYTFDASRTETKEAILATFLPNGYQIVRDSEFQLVLDRPASDNFGAQLLFGSQWNTVPNARVMLTFIGDKPTQVTANLSVVTNPGSGFERITDISQNPDARSSLSRGMEQARQRFLPPA